MTIFGVTKSTSGATGSTSSISSLEKVAIECWSTTRLEIGGEAIGTRIKLGVL